MSGVIREPGAVIEGRAALLVATVIARDDPARNEVAAAWAFV